MNIFPVKSEALGTVQCPGLSFFSKRSALLTVGPCDQALLSSPSVFRLGKKPKLKKYPSTSGVVILNHMEPASLSRTPGSNMVALSFQWIRQKVFGFRVCTALLIPARQAARLHERKQKGQRA